MLEGSRYWIGSSSKLSFGVSKLKVQNFVVAKLGFGLKKSYIVETKAQTWIFI
jgi:hypothetical protein